MEFFNTATFSHTICGRLAGYLEFAALVSTEAGSEWSGQDRVNWLTMAASIFKMIYTEQTPSVIKIGISEGTSSAT